MAKNTQTIRIESILGGTAPSSHFSAPDQFRGSVGIDPSFGLDDDPTGNLDSQPCGLLRPTAFQTITSSLAGAPYWLIANPKDRDWYCYDSAGSVYTVGSTGTPVTGIGDLNDGGSASGNGAAYYDNYIYFSRDTTIARYGPLNGTPAFTDDFWVGTLGLTALANTTYPQNVSGGALSMNNHILHRHSDGRLYILDVVDNQGTIHYIQTTKTTVEGDTDDGSTYDKVNVGYGLWPTAIATYGDQLVIGFLEKETDNTGDPPINAKIAFWDTTSEDVNQIIWVEFPDTIVVGIKNLNGVLHIISTGLRGNGFRLLKYIGGYSFEEVFFSSASAPPNGQGAIGSYGEQLFFGGTTQTPTNGGAVFSFGLKSLTKTGFFTPFFIGSTGGSNKRVTSLAVKEQTSPVETTPILGWSTGTTHGIDYTPSGNIYDNASSEWWSQMYRIGQPFKITKIRIPLAQAVATNMSVIPKIYVDEGVESFTLTTINDTNYPNSERNIVIRPENLTGQHNFFLELSWPGSALCIVGLPITIEYELIDD